MHQSSLVFDRSLFEKRFNLLFARLIEFLEFDVSSMSQSEMGCPSIHFAFVAREQCSFFELIKDATQVPFVDGTMGHDVAGYTGLTVVKFVKDACFCQ